MKPMNEIRRRALLGGASATALLMPKAVHAASAQVSVTDPPFLANQAASDNTNAFNQALEYISSQGGGVLKVPPGNYQCSGPLTYRGSSLTILGCGQEESILVIKHTQTALDVTLLNNNCSLTVRDLGMSPLPQGGNWGGIGIGLTVPAAAGAWQNCLIENVDLGVPYAENGAQYTAFYNAIALNGTWRARINNVNCHANNVTGGIFITLVGTCIDTRVLGCSLDGYAFGVVVRDYSEGLHIEDMVFIGGTAVQTGIVDYNQGINLLGLYITGCEFNCRQTALCGYQVNSAWITDTDFSVPTGGVALVACLLQGASRVHIENTHFDGNFNVNVPTNQVAILATSSTARPTGSCLIANCSFENTGTALVLGPNSFAMEALGLEMFQAGLGALVSAPIQWGSITQQVLLDNSGVSGNNISWLSASGTQANRISQSLLHRG